MKNLLISIIFFTILFFVACDKNEENNPEVPQSVIDMSLGFFDGEVISTDLENDEDENAWEIQIQNSNGSIVEFYWSEDRETLLKIEGQNSPFDYEIQPGNDLINFSTARTVAIGALKNNVIAKWELEQEEDFIDDWVYTFEFDDAGDTRKVYIDAASGDVLQID